MRTTFSARPITKDHFVVPLIAVCVRNNLRFFAAVLPAHFLGPGFSLSFPRFLDFSSSSALSQSVHGIAAFPSSSLTVLLLLLLLLRPLNFVAFPFLLAAISPIVGGGVLSLSKKHLFLWRTAFHRSRCFFASAPFFSLFDGI